MFRRGLGRGLLGLLGVGTVGTTVGYHSHEGFQRQFTFWKGAFPIFLHYRWTQHSVKSLSDYEQELAFAVLHDRYAEEVRDLTLQLKGFFLKNAQIMSTRDDFVPEAYLAWAKRLQNQVPSELSVAEAKRLVEESCGVSNIYDVFSEWVDEPIACASIGQVHKARLRSTGQLVAVKVQYPGMEAIFRRDIATLITFCKLAMPQHVTPLEHIQAHFDAEFDYELEASHLEMIGRNVNTKWGKRVYVPQPMMELCSRNVLVMEYLEGQKLDVAVKKQYSKIARRYGKTLEELEAEQRHKFAAGQMQLRSLDQERRRHGMVAMASRVADVFRNAFALLFNFSLGWLPGVPLLDLYWTDLPVNLSEVLRTLLMVHAHEILIDGAFNADPHPGNILLMPDGRLGLVDYGQVTRVDVRFRKLYAELLQALRVDDKEAIVRISRDKLGIRSKYSVDDVFYRYMAFWHDRDTDDVTQGRNVQEFSDYVEDVDPVVEISGEMVMTSRVSVLLRGMGLAFGIRLKYTDCIAPIIEQALALYSEEQ